MVCECAEHLVLRYGLGGHSRIRFGWRHQQKPVFVGDQGEHAEHSRARHECSIVAVADAVQPVVDCI